MKQVKKKKNNKKKSKSKLNLVNKAKEKINSRLLIIVAFFSGVLLIFASYAWLSASLDVKVKFFDLVVSTDNGLFISLDGINFSDAVEISSDNLIKNLKATYPNNTSQWSLGGLWPVSSNGIKDTNSDKFSVYNGEISRFRQKTNNRRFLNTRLINENNLNNGSAFIAFDIFLKNVSGSPKSDNLYLDEGTGISFADDTAEDVKDSMANIMNSIRFGLVKINSVSSKSDINSIQNMKCNNNCSMLIYEPNSTSHSEASIVSALEHNINLTDGIYTPTYGVIASGQYLEHVNGQEGTNIPLDKEHFALQKTITDFENPIFQIPNGITKLRVYVWIEGQDVDSLETRSDGAQVYLALNFIKDLAGYE